MTSSRELRDALRRVLTAHHSLDARRRSCGARLSMAHAHALLTLSQAPEALSLGTLATSLNIDRSNVSRLCARMQALDQIQLSTDPADGRARRVQLTPRGQQQATQIDASSARHFDQVVGALGAQAPAVLDAMKLLADALAGANSGTGQPAGQVRLDDQCPPSGGKGLRPSPHRP